MADTSPFVIVLFPEQQLANKTIQLSQKLQEQGTRFTLQEDMYYSHLTLFMAQLPDKDLKQVQTALAAMAKETNAMQLTATKYHQDNEGMIEVQYSRPESLIHLQQKVIEAISPLRSGLREKNPVGYSLPEQLENAKGEERENLESYGYDEIGNLFRPHITFTRFIAKDKADTTAFPPVEIFSGKFPTLAICTLGDNGTCLEIVEQYPL